MKSATTLTQVVVCNVQKKQKMKLKELYAIAKKELADISPIENSDFRLEQAEYNKKEKIWEIVVSYLVENTNKPIKAFAALAPEFKYHRIYKTVKIDDLGKIIGFYIYTKE